MKIKLYSALFLIGLVSLLLIGFCNSEYFKIKSSFEIFSSVFREVANHYVLDIDPEIMIRKGIEGMLSTLDPYTEFYSNDMTDDLDAITSGFYTGFGFTVSQINGDLTIVDLNEKYSAYKQGIRIGDRLLQIDTAVVISFAGEQLKQYTRGEIGSQANVRILREGISDTLNFVLTRQSIALPNITYYGVTSNNIGYIKIESFTRSTAGEVKNALNRLKNQYQIQGIVLDFRNNPGGLMASAVAIVEMFVPKGSLIVSTKGKRPSDVVEYFSITNPIELDLPLAVMINENSASASEIVAGAIQDLDRGIVVGQRSFGKGLVQSVFNLPYNSYLKMTTSKYYTPSGRCIQKIKFGDLYNKEEVTQSIDTALFYTKNGRTVFEMRGILPDTVVNEDTIPDIIRSLGDKGLLFNFATFYSSKFDSLPVNFEISNQIFSEFENYLKKKDFIYLSRSGEHLNQVELALESGNYSKKARNNLTSLKNAVAEEDSKELRKHKTIISKYLKFEILSRFYPRSKMIELMLDEDNELSTAASILNSDKYLKILSINKND